MKKEFIIAVLFFVILNIVMEEKPAPDYSNVGGPVTMFNRFDLVQLKEFNGNGWVTVLEDMNGAREEASPGQGGISISCNVKPGQIFQIAEVQPDVSYLWVTHQAEMSSCSSEYLIEIQTNSFTFNLVNDE